MDVKAFVYGGSRIDAARDAVESGGGEVLADYGESLLVRFDDAALGDLDGAGFRTRRIETSDSIRVRGYDVRPADLTDATPSVEIVAPASGVSHHVITLVGPMHPDWSDELASTGASVIQRLDGESYLVGVAPDAVPAVGDLSFVESVAPYTAPMKINPSLLDRDVVDAVDAPPGMTADPEVVASAGAVDVGPPNRELDMSNYAVGRATRPRSQVEVVLFDAQDAAGTESQLDALGVNVVSARGTRLVIDTDAAGVASVAALGQVREVNPHAENRLQNNVATGIMRADALLANHGLDGSGQIVAIGDSGLDTGVDDASMLDDFQGRSVAIFALGRPGDASDVNGHGTHVAGSVLGDGSNSSGNIRGTAPAARYVFQSLEDPGGGLGGIPADVGVGLFDVARDEGAHIHTNSWGADVGGAYTSDSADADAFAFANREFLICFSAGNDAPNRVGSPGTAKNVLTIGASENTRAVPATVAFPASPAFPSGAVASNFDLAADDANDVAGFSSVGPAQNNRVKPDVVAPGTWILSVRSSVCVYDAGPDGLGENEVGPGGTGDEDGIPTHAEAVGLGLPGQPVFGTGDQNTPAAPAGSGASAADNYMYLSGTSMATPLAAGTCALVRQYLVEQRGHVPSAALIKALVINGAVDMGLGIPDNGQGWGRADLTESLFPAVTERVQFDDSLDSAVSTGTIRSYDVHVSTQTEPLSVTLVWRDPPGPTIQNQLHLRVTPLDTMVTVVSDPIGNIRNNVQKVVIPAPVPGTYRVEVEGVSVGTGVPELPGLQQDFALAVGNATGFSCNPSDLVQVLDRSGSMGIFGYMEPAKERAKQFVDILQINDRTGVVTFNSAASPGVPVPLGTVSSQVDKIAIKEQIDLVTSSGNTDLREALADGLTTLGADVGRPRAIVYLSDGHHTVADPDIDNAFLASVAAQNVKVYTIALGPSSDLAVLNNIAAETGTGAAYQVESAADLHKLHEIYYDILGGVDCGGVVHLQSAPVASDGAQDRRFALDNTVREALFSASWDEVGAEVGVELVAPGGDVIGPGDIDVAHHAGSSYAFYRAVRPKGGRWTIRLRRAGGGAPVTSITSAVLAESDIVCNASFERRRGNKSVLRLGAQFDGKALSGGRASAQITFATRSVAELLRKYADALREIEIDHEAVKRAGDDPDLVRLGLLADVLGRKGHDIFERETVKLDLEEDERGTGTHLATINLADLGPGDNAEVRLSYDYRDRWLGHHQCTKVVPIRLPEGRSGGSSISITDLFVRRNRRWPYSIIGVRVGKGSRSLLGPDDVRVSMTVTHRGRRHTVEQVGYYRRGRYFLCRLDHQVVASGSNVTVEAQVWVGDDLVAEDRRPFRL